MTQAALICRVNGRDQQQISLFDRGFQFGDSIFETARFYIDRCPFWALHLKRFSQACERLAFHFDVAKLQAEYQEVCQLLQAQGQREAIVKFQLSRGESLRGYARPDGEANLVALAFSAEPCDQRVSPKKLELSPINLARQPLLAGLKHGNRLEQVLARRQLSPGCDDAILLDSEQHVIEAISSNLFYKQDGCWLTPDLSFSGVAGVVRAYLLECEALTVSQTPLTVEQLLRSDAICLANSVQGIQAVESLLISSGPLQGLHKWQGQGETVMACESLSQIYQEGFTLPVLSSE
ncbi:aminodeoxychorismate lyase [uncultured Pseudoteredinibacter sp.]|uniref:aminodeoxychorismate lyase n=1 Tax=uncultured Pseudoteredinibacter sp. TaxID=1641701 RepID=UPI0026022D96|nr:aminodeoxychorismate lyase [uncultured Pseudoteredinibacter sp.]